MLVLVNAPMLAIFGGVISGIALAVKFDQWSLILTAPIICAGILIFSYDREREGQSKIFMSLIILSFIFALRIYHAFEYDKPEANINFERAEGLVTFTRAWGKMQIAVIKTYAGNFLIRTPFLNYPTGTRINELANRLGVSPGEIVAGDDSNVKSKAATNNGMLVFEDGGTRVELPPTEKGYELFNKLVENLIKKQAQE